MSSLAGLPHQTDSFAPRADGFGLLDGTQQVAPTSSDRYSPAFVRHVALGQLLRQVRQARHEV
jgi:hypothetical protein